MELIAHRGLSARFPENSAAAFRAALGAGCDGIESDLRLAADGGLWLFHDDDTRRLTGAPGTIEARGADELRALRIRGEPLLELSGLLALLPRATRLRVNLELKGAPAAQARLAESLAARAAAGDFAGLRVVVSSFHHPALGALARGAKLPLAPLWRGAGKFADLLATAAALGAEAIHLSRHAASRPRCARARAASLAVRCYTVNDPAEAARLEALGVNALFSDDPAALRAALRDRIPPRSDNIPP